MSLDTQRIADEVVDIVAAAKPLLQGRSPEIQGMVLSELVALFLVGHPRQYRDAVLECIMVSAVELTVLNEHLLFGAAGHPGNDEASRYVEKGKMT